MYLLVPIINFIGLELVYFRYSKLIYFVLLAVIVLSLRFVYKNIKKQNEFRLSITLSLALFIISHYLLLIFLDNFILVQLFIVLTSFALFVFMYSVYDKYSVYENKLNYALENVIGYFNLAIFFFLSVGLLHLNLQSNQKFIWFLLAFIFFVSVLSYSSLKIFDIIKGKGVLYLSVIILIITQTFWIASLLPISVYSIGAIVTLVYYVLIGLSKHYLIFGLEEFSKKILFRYITISLSGIFLSIITSRW